MLCSNTARSDVLINLDPYYGRAKAFSTDHNIRVSCASASPLRNPDAAKPTWSLPVTAPSGDPDVGQNAVCDQAPPADSLGRLTNLIMVALSMLLTLSLLWLLSDVILLLFAAVLLACQLTGAAGFLSRHTLLSYSWALLLVVALGSAGIGLFVWLHGPVFLTEVTNVIQNVNDQVTGIWRDAGNIDALTGAIERLKAMTPRVGSYLPGYAAGFVTSTLGGLGSGLLILVASIYLAASPGLYRDGFVGLMPHVWRRHGMVVLRAEAHTLRWWFMGQLIDMAAIGLLIGIGLLLLGVKLAFTLAFIAALCNFVPYIGALVGSLPAILVALSQSPEKALYVAGLFLVVQTLEGNAIAPFILKRTVAVPPVVTLLSQTVLGTLFGPMGLILATPVTAAGLVLVQRVYKEKILGDAPEDS
jgi:predicted PurR-regulated permease PerM